MRFLNKEEDKAAWDALRSSTKKVADGRMSDSTVLLLCPMCGEEITGGQSRVMHWLDESTLKTVHRACRDKERAK